VHTEFMYLKIRSNYECHIVNLPRNVNINSNIYIYIYIYDEQILFQTYSTNLIIKVTITCFNHLLWPCSGSMYHTTVIYSYNVMLLIANGKICKTEE
jgi:hypothetical protein